MVVEDNEVNRLLLTILLEEIGFEIRHAENGREAVNLFEQWHSDLIWMDMRMPVMDGYEATAKIRSMQGGGKVKIVAITASAFREERQRILDVGCDAVVLKPYQDSEIFDTMAKLLAVRYTYEEKNQPVESTL